MSKAPANGGAPARARTATVLVLLLAATQAVETVVGTKNLLELGGPLGEGSVIARALVPDLVVDLAVIAALVATGTGLRRRSPTARYFGFAAAGMAVWLLLYGLKTSVPLIAVVDSAQGFFTLVWPAVPAGVLGVLLFRVLIDPDVRDWYEARRRTAKR